MILRLALRTIGLKLGYDWKQVLTKAWSVRLMIAAAFFSGMESVLPIVEPYLPIPAGIFAILSGLTTAAALVARIVVQRNMPEAEPADKEIIPATEGKA